MSNPLWPLSKIRAPKADNRDAAGFHVGVLREVIPHPLLLPVVRVGKPLRVPMPIVAVKLDNKIMLRHKGVNAKLLIYSILGHILNAERVQNAIAYPLYAGRACLLLHCIHSHQLGAPFGVFASAPDRAVLDVVLLGMRGRPCKLFPANFTDKVILVASLPLYLVVKTTKEMTGIFKALLGHIDFTATPSASHNLAGAPVVSPPLDGMLGTTIRGLAVHRFAANGAEMIAGARSDNAAVDRAIGACAIFIRRVGKIFKRSPASGTSPCFARHLAGLARAPHRAEPLKGGRAFCNLAPTLLAHESSF